VVAFSRMKVLFFKNNGWTTKHLPKKEVKIYLPKNIIFDI